MSTLVLLRMVVEPHQGATYDQQLAMARTAEGLVTLAGLARETTSLRLGSLVTSSGTGWFDDEHRAYGILDFDDLDHLRLVAGEVMPQAGSG